MTKNYDWDILFKDYLIRGNDTHDYIIYNKSNHITTKLYASTGEMYSTDEAIIFLKNLNTQDEKSLLEYLKYRSDDNTRLQQRKIEEEEKRSHQKLIDLGVLAGD